MSYSQKDKSVDDSQPIEVYKFIGTFGTFRYTSNYEAVTVDGEEYTPLPITRTAVEISSVLDSIQTVDFVLPVETELAYAYCFLTSPKKLTVEVRRVHRGDDFSTDFKIEWIGVGLDSSVSGNWATIKTGSTIQSYLSGNIGNIIYQRSCNHRLYDERCKVNKADFTLTATITKVQSQYITVDDDGAGNSELKNGQMIVDRTGESRGITTNVNNKVTVSYAFIDVQIGDTITMYYGCNHSRLGDCKERFDNVINYGGFDFIPTINPFDELAKDNQARVVKTVNTEVKQGKPITSYGEFT